ncbi:MAG: DUF2235 domain-containing protein [Pseudomonadota bacterium]
MPKNIVLCLDGTGNSIHNNRSSVLRLFSLIDKAEPQKGKDAQVCYYDTGIGTVGHVSSWFSWPKEKIDKIRQGLGAGMEQNVIDAYGFLCRHYEDGDRIMIYGFSRGAFTACVLAAFVHNMGLLRPHDLHLAVNCLAAYKLMTSKDIDDGDRESRFRPIRYYERALRPPHRPPIHFLGLFDTVNSVIVPVGKASFDLSSINLANAKSNPSVLRVRQALAIDERRRNYRPVLWDQSKHAYLRRFPRKDDQGEFLPTDVTEQDVEQVWFAGYHSDVGGSSTFENLPADKRDDNAYAKVALEWMIDHSPKELRFLDHWVTRKVRGEQTEQDKTDGRTWKYAKPDPVGLTLSSMTPVWKALEWFPIRKRKWTYPKPNREIAGFVWPTFEPRFIPTDHTVHESVFMRRDQKSYAPENLEDYLSRRPDINS